jgi:flagellar biosynthesis protein FlhG
VTKEQESPDKSVAPRESQIWAIAGGKGGTGKTFLVSGIATYLAKKQNRVTMVDLDLGGANLHSFFGLTTLRPSLTTFFEFGSRLDELSFPTGIENLSLVTGNAESMTSGSIKFSQKLKLYRQMAKLNTQYMIVDLGAGCHPNTLDTFIIADRMITVMVPEITSAENMYVFIKNALFRKVKAALKGPQFKNLVRDTWDRRESLCLRNIKDLIDHIRYHSPEADEKLGRELAGFKIHILVNMTRDHKDIALGFAVKSVLQKYLGLDASYAGMVEHDDAVRQSVREARPFMLNHLSSPCTKQIEDLTENIVQGRDVRLPGLQS